MTDGVRSLQAFWMGGAGAAPAPAATGGVRSLQAHWMGGAGATAVVTNGGARSLLAFWMGGAAGTEGVAADVYPGAGHPTGIFWGVRKVKKGRKLDDLLKQAMEQIVHGDIEVSPNTPVARAVDIIKPHIETRKQDSITPISSINWSAVEKDLKTVKELLRLWDEQMRIMDDEDILLLSEW